MEIKITYLQYFKELKRFTLEFYISGFEREYEANIEGMKMSYLWNYRTEAERENLRIAADEDEFYETETYWELKEYYENEQEIERAEVLKYKEEIEKLLIEEIKKDPLHRIRLITGS